MNIAVIYLGRKGGGAVYSYEMAKALCENGNDVIAVVSEYIENLAYWKCLNLSRLVIIPTYTTKLTYLTNTALFRWKAGRILKRALKDVSVDCAYIPMTAYWDKKVLSYLTYKQLVTTIHDVEPHSGEKWFNKGGYAEKKADKIVVLSERFVETVKSRFNKPVAFVPHGRMCFYKNNFSSGLREEEGSVKFLFYGRIEAYKGLQYLIDAFERMEARHETQKPQLVIAGPGDLSCYSIRSKNITVINEWMDARRTNDLFSSGKFIVVLPYTDASQSGVVPIAVEYAQPVIATQTGGLCEQIEDGVTGILVPPCNIAELENAMEALYGNPALCEKLTCNALAKAEELNWDKLAARLTKFMEG